MRDLVAAAQGGNRRALARLISAVERGQAAEVVAAVHADTGRAHVVGVTGSPGSGKSTLVTALALALRGVGQTVGIIAVDPTSPFTGGAILGDRVRMRELSGDAGVFIRSMATRGSLGGLALATSAAVKVLDAAGFDVILVETVGAGQSEVEIASAAHTTLVIEAPGMGDEVQTIKAGIMEIADILVVNKSDKRGAAHTVKALKNMVGLSPKGGTRHHGRILASDAAVAQKAEAEGAWQVPVLAVSALEGEGIEPLVEQIAAHRQHLMGTGQWATREAEGARREVETLLTARLLAMLREQTGDLDEVVAAVARREMDAYAAVEKIIAGLQDTGYK